LTFARRALPIASVLIILGLVVLLVPPILHLVPTVRASNRTITLIGNLNGWNYTTNHNPPITVVQGDIVTMQLSSTDTKHNFLVDVDNDLYDNSDCPIIDPCSPSFTPGTPTTYTFPVNFAPGNYTYYCTFHPGNMLGRFIVKGFTIASNPASLTLIPGTTATSTITLTNHNAFSGIVGLTASSSPNGPAVSVNPATITMSPTTASATTILTVNATASRPGSYIITVNATSGSSTQATTLAVTVAAPDFSISVNPASVDIAQGAMGTATIALSSINGFSGTANLTARGFPPGHPVSFDPVSVALSSGGAGTSTMTISVPAPSNCPDCAQIIAYFINITATSGSLSHTATVRVNVTLSGSSPSVFANFPLIVVVGSVVVIIAVAGIAGYLMINKKATTDQTNHAVS
jgi:uncharacterized membrane protein